LLVDIGRSELRCLHGLSEWRRRLPHCGEQQLPPLGVATQENGPEQVKKDFDALEIKLRRRRARQSVWSAAAYRSGTAAGDRIPLSRGVKSEWPTDRLK